MKSYGGYNFNGFGNYSWIIGRAELCSMNEEFSSHQNEQGDANDTPDGASVSVDLDRSVETSQREGYPGRLTHCVRYNLSQLAKPATSLGTGQVLKA